MRLSIPVTALISLLVNTGNTIAAPRRAFDIASPNPKSKDNFTCNEPFMIPAEYIDSEGNSFAMCFSDPRFHRENVIWYIQAQSGPFKAVGVARRRGGDEFVGSVIPIEQPADRSGMHAEPVAVRVHLDRSSGVITVNPRNTGGKLINWIIRPNGFPVGSLKVPDSCGPFLKPLRNRDMLAPLTGASPNAKVCVIPGAKADAFFSWGHYEHPGDTDPLAIDGGIDPKFFSMGFVGADRGVSIDICDPGSGEANRCEMSRLVGHTRKTFVVGTLKDDHLIKDPKDFNDIKGDVKACDLNKHKNGRRRRHRHAHEIRSDALVKRIETIERDIHTMLERRSRRKNLRRNRIVDEVDPVESAAFYRHGELVDRPREELIDRPREQLIDRPRVERFEHIRSDRLDHPRVERFEHRLDRPRAKVAYCRHNGTLARDRFVDRPREEFHRDDIYRLNRLDRLDDSDFYRPVRKAEFVAETRRFDDRISHDGDILRASRIADPLPRVDRIVDPLPCDHRHRHPRRHCRHPRRHPRHGKCKIHPLIREDAPAPVKAAVISPAVAPIVNPRPITPVAPAPVVNPQQLNRLRERLNRLDARLDRAESLIAARLTRFNRWLRQQKLAMKDRARDFAHFLAKLKEDAVYTPKSSKTKRNVFRRLGRTLRHETKELVDGSDSDVTSAKKKSLLSSVKDKLENVTTGTVNTAGDLVDNTVSATGNVVDGVAGTADNIADNTIGAAGNIADNTAGAAGSVVDNTVGTARRAVRGTADTAVNIVTPAPAAPVAPARAVAVSDRFDLNDDLLPPARASLAKGSLVADPLGPGGPALPPPAVEKFASSRANSDPIRAAIDYLN